MSSEPRATAAKGSARVVSPFVLAAAITAGVWTLVLAAQSRAAGGAFVPPLDDAYIHFSVAHTIAAYGSYGLQPHAFSTPASSLAWPLLLALGDRMHLPLEGVALVLGAGAALGALRIVDRVLTEAEVGSWLRAVLLVAWAFFVPIVPMALLAMEHALHIALVLALVAMSLHSAPIASARRLVLLALLAAAAISVRYETGFIIVGLALWMVVIAPLAERAAGIRATLAMAAGAGAVILGAGAFFVGHGAPPLPLSVLLKRSHAEAGDPSSILLGFVGRLAAQPHVPLFVLAAGLMAITAQSRTARGWLFVGVFALLAQAAFAQLGWLYRYESYAVAVLFVGFALVAAERTISAPRWLVLAMLAFPGTLRAAFAHATLPKASRNVAEQQRTMAMFVREVAPRGAVAVNDVGAVSYLGGARVLDLMGLADVRVARARHMRIDGPLPAADIARLTAADGVALAILYEPWFVGVLPPEWVPLERWRIHDNRVCAFDTVTLFATSAAEAGELRRSLAAFRARLPPGVEALPVPVAPGAP